MEKANRAVEAAAQYCGSPDDGGVGGYRRETGRAVSTDLPRCVGRRAFGAGRLQRGEQLGGCAVFISGRMAGGPGRVEAIADHL